MKLGPFFALAFLAAIAPMGASGSVTIVVSKEASPLETLAAREVRRYLYLRTGELAPVVPAEDATAGDAVIVSRSDRLLAAGAKTGPLAAQQYALKGDGHRVWIVGGDDVGTLYAAYRFAERLGVRFYLNGDVIPDLPLPAGFPIVDETGNPLFSVRGIQPFHDFPEGPDWWNRDDYLATIAQLPKLRMNFIGFHTYPENDGVAEPGVWIGLPADTDKSGKVGFSYPSEWANTGRGEGWNYAATRTSEFTGGAGLLFEKDLYGPDVLAGLLPFPKDPADCNTVFNRTAALFRVAFSEAHFLGVKTCIGTETPLGVPKRVRERLKQLGKDPGNPAVLRELYEGMFRRIEAACPVDTYWLWTPESWTWDSNKPGEFQATTRDIGAALAALDTLGHPFALATSGWVLGPKEDRAALDRFLPKDCPMSCINRNDGHAPIEPGFANVTGRPKWAIPWLENDPSLTAPEPWVARMRYEAADALRLGCTGLIGIHWRTKAIEGNVAALANAAWEQPWIPPGFDRSPIKPGSVAPDGGPAGNDKLRPRRNRAMPAEDFYVDFARVNFGDSVAKSAGGVLARIDGVNLPDPAAWLKGPGGVRIETTPWSELGRRYGFVQELAAMRGSVKGRGNLERFDYWLNTYRAMATMAESGCQRGELDREMAAILSEKDPARRLELAKKAVLVRIRLARLWERLIAFQIAITDTPGELGTLTNLEEHSRVYLQLITGHDLELEKELGAPLPAAARLSREYAGPSRIAVPTVRTLAQKGEALTLRVLIVESRPAARGSLHYRTLGTGEWHEVPLSHVARAVYTVTTPPLNEDTEYFISAITASGDELAWPVTAPGLAQTVVVH